MIWLAPWALLSLGAVALPVILHLLGRGRAVRHRFPTLRFLQASQLLPTRRTRLHDIPLLLVRAAVIALAALATAQPLWSGADRRQAADAALARAVIVDTSSSMRRLTVGVGERGVDEAQRGARQLAAEAALSIVIPTAYPASAVAGASAWLRRTAGRGELVVVSDFQAGTVDSAALATVPAEAGVRFARIRVVSDSALGTQLSVSDRVVDVRAVHSAGGIDVSWMPEASAAMPSPVTIVDKVNQSGARVANAAAATVGVQLPFDSSRDIAVVFRSSERSAAPVHTPWMVEALAALRPDTTVVAAQDSVNGHQRLLLFPSSSPSSIESATLIAAAARELSAAPLRAELEPAFVPDTDLSRWERAPSAEVTSRSNGDPLTGASDARWVWIAVLLLLGVESRMRRATVAAQRTESVERDRAA